MTSPVRDLRHPDSFSDCAVDPRRGVCRRAPGRLDIPTVAGRPLTTDSDGAPSRRVDRIRGAVVAMDFAFDELKLDEIVVHTTYLNMRSQAVMRRLNLTHDPGDDFTRPGTRSGTLAAGSCSIEQELPIGANEPSRTTRNGGGYRAGRRATPYTPPGTEGHRSIIGRSTAGA